MNRFVARAFAVAMFVVLASQSLAAFAAAPPATASPPSAVPEGERARAAGLREQGNQAMLDMRYVDALALYRQALALDPSDTGVLYSIARAHQLLGEFPEALTALEQFGERASPENKARVGRLDELFTDLRARVGTVTLDCNVRGARVMIRDRVIGTTPLPPFRFSAGAATLEVELDGFFPARTQIVVPAGGAIVQTVTLRARAHSGLLLVRTLPGGAHIAVDGEARGTSTPAIELVLPEGTHRVLASRDGYDDANVPLLITAGETRTLEMPLHETAPLTRRWWFWTGAAVVVAGGIALTAALLTERPPDRGGTLAQISAPLRF